MFYAVLALLAQGKKETSKHSGAIAIFDRDFVKQGIFKKNYSRWLHDAFDLRQRSDYAAEYHASPEDAKITLKNAETFVNAVKKVLSKEL
jgi:uncharacterized protein (UPF0332 family)